MNKRYEIDEDNMVKIFFGDSESPMIVQAKWPNGDDWADSSEAENWAILFIAATEPDATLHAPAGRDLEPQRKLTATEISLLSEAEKAVKIAESKEDREVAIEAFKQVRISLGL